MMLSLLQIIRWQKLRKVAASLLLILLLTPATALAMPLPTHTVATTAPDPAIITQCKKSSFLGLKPWYYFMDKELDDGNNAKGDPCSVKCFNLLQRNDPNDCGQEASDVPLILLAIIDDVLQLSGIVAVGYVLYGAIQYTTSQGSPDATQRAQSTIINALIGLAIASIAVVTVSFIGKALA